MTPAIQALPIQLSQEVLDFAVEEHVSEYLPQVADLTRRIFPDAPVSVIVSEDPEIANDRHIVFELTIPADVDEALAARRRWNDGLFACCPAPLVCVFRLSLDLVER